MSEYDKLISRALLQHDKRLTAWRAPKHFSANLVEKYEIYHKLMDPLQFVKIIHYCFLHTNSMKHFLQLLDEQLDTFSSLALKRRQKLDADEQVQRENELKQQFELMREKLKQPRD
ncbi:hypothetical protein EJF36_15190 [Bacillus sp. HMF5848]|uniref:hypothetical protein n=1 Tax=Bacillus sp. HMF5848 TaxID=2495421 RepID=UPI000F772C0B|nr:hypothetical protein [Bacillus sp. HMF5848]RSK28115.1 hypothetical protein EJF36_15190 [Bacillus sp. HMF5848]